MDDLDGFYDVHGPFFKQFADKANAMGFGVTDVFTAAPEQLAMRKVFESGGTPSNEAEALYAFFDAGHKAFEYRDADNWYVEIF